jgi:uncharacterized protein involved in exopolysaccharide biosynthesis
MSSTRYGSTAEPLIEASLREADGESLGRYLQIARRRAGLLVATTAAGLATAALVAYLLPPVYRSSAVILIQEQEIPAEFVRSTVTSFADERIQVISQQVMTSTVLLGLIDKHRLYEDLRRFEPSDVVVERMRNDIRVEPISVDITDRRTGLRSVATIAFRLSYQSEQPVAAQRVANELVSLYLNENLKNRQQRAAEAAEFLAAEAERLARQLGELDARVAQLKQRSQGSLPQLSDFNLQLVDRMDQELVRVDRDISEVQQRIIVLEGQLAQVQPQGPLLSATGERVLDPAARLKLLRAQYASLSGIYSTAHPDLARMRKEIAALERETGDAGGAAADFRKELDQLEARLAAARDRYGDDHPDVAKLRKAVAAVASELRAAEAAPAGAPRRPPQADNPVYVTLQTQIQAAQAQLAALRAYRGELVAKSRQYQARLERIPEVEREFLDVLRERENAQNRFRDVREKQMKAQVAQEMEKDRKAERFTLIEPPQLPERPYKPNRPAILLLGFVLSLGGALGVASIKEALDRTVRGAADLAGRIAAPLLGVIPADLPPAAARRRRRRLWVGLVAAAVALAALLALVHVFYRPLDVLWYILLRRLRIG